MTQFFEDLQDFVFPTYRLCKVSAFVIFFCKLFHGNNGTAQDPVFNMITPSIIARYVRLYPVSGGPSGIGGVAPREYCVRAEIFAEHQCNFHLLLNLVDD